MAGHTGLHRTVDFKDNVATEAMTAHDKSPRNATSSYVMGIKGVA
jgi:hypothetical protein